MLGEFDNAKSIQLLISPRQFDTSTHDVGFVMYGSLGKALLLENITLPERKAYTSQLVNAAHSLASRYSPVVGAIRSWDNSRSDPMDSFKVIIDNMMNLELLFVASQLPGGLPEWKEMAIRHTQSTLKNFVRGNSTTYHLITYRYCISRSE
jgi:hypothetical protein